MFLIFLFPLPNFSIYLFYKLTIYIQYDYNDNNFRVNIYIKIISIVDLFYTRTNNIKHKYNNGIYSLEVSS